MSPKLLLGRYGVAIRFRKSVVLTMLTRRCAGFMVGVLRTHEHKSPLLEKISYWLNYILPGTGRLIVRSTEMRCFVIAIPGPIGPWWWAPGQSRVRA